MKLWNIRLMAMALCAMTASTQAQDRYEPERRDTQIRGDQVQRNSDPNSRPDENDSWYEWYDDWASEEAQEASHQRSSNQAGRDARESQADNEKRTTGYRGDSGREDNEQSQRESHSSWSRSQSKSIPEGIESFFARYDENDDNAISRNELAPRMQGNFDQIDGDGNGRLSASELRQHSSRQQKLQQPVLLTYVWVVDANRGRMKLEDLQEAYSVLSEIDRNGNGRISHEELQARREQVANRMVDRCFNNHDENEDDRLTRQEAEGTALAGQFGKLDRNKDGKVSRNEAKNSLREQLQQQSNESEEARQSGDFQETASRDSERSS